MTFQIGLVLTILVLSVILFASEIVRPDIVAMLVLCTLAVTQLVTPAEAFSGFANPAVVTVVAIFIISEGLLQTGVADFLGVRILKMAKASEVRLIIILMLTVGLVSAFINNVGATAVFLPATLVIARRAKSVPSKLLIPIAFASAMGGNLTLIGTPPNILASAILQEYQGCQNFSFGCRGFGFFDFTPMGLLILGFGTFYMAVIGRHLLPSYKTEIDLSHSYRVREYLSEIRVLPSSPLVGRTIIESRFGQDYGLTIVGIIRENRNYLAVRRNDLIQANDTLLVEGSLDKILEVHRSQGLTILPEIEHQQDAHLESREVGVAEVILDIGSLLAGQSIKQIRFREKYRLNVLALRHRGQSVTNSLANEPLAMGDVLLVQGRREHIELLRTNTNFLLLEPVHLKARRTDKAPVALSILGLILLVATLGWLHVSIAAVIGAILMIILGILNVDEAYQAIDWQSIFLIAGMLPLGVAMESSNAANFLAHLITEQMMQFGSIGILGGIYLLTALLTQVMSNAAATVLLAPIAINVALNLGAAPPAFVMAVVVAASSSFLTPIAHQSNILVFGPGAYKFMDFIRVGIGLTLLNLILVVIALPLIWPLFP